MNFSFVYYVLSWIRIKHQVALRSCASKINYYLGKHILLPHAIKCGTLNYPRSCMYIVCDNLWNVEMIIYSLACTCRCGSFYSYPSKQVIQEERFVIMFGCVRIHVIIFIHDMKIQLQQLLSHRGLLESDPQGKVGHHICLCACMQTFYVYHFQCNCYSSYLGSCGSCPTM